MIKKLKTIFNNITSPKFRFIYTTLDGKTEIYIIQNPRTFRKSTNRTTFSNDASRERGDYNIGIRAKCLTREGQVRSFYYDRMRELHKISIFEEVVV